MTNSNQPWQLLEGDCLKVLATLPAESVQTCITSPPYWGLRDYGSEGQLGLESTPEAYVANMVAVFREVRRVLRYDGTLWLNLGDSYFTQPAGNKTPSGFQQNSRAGQSGALAQYGSHGYAKKLLGLKPKDLVGIPWRVAFALQADGWYLRQDIIWHKPNPMPESATDRSTKAHEYIFLMTKSARYFYDAEAVKEPNSESSGKWGKMVPTKTAQAQGAHGKTSALTTNMTREECVDKYYTKGRNKRSVWTVTTKPFKGAHFATFPFDLIEPCVLAGSADKCCPKCGNGWERLTESTKTFESGSGKSGNPIVGKQDLTASETNSTPDIRKGPCVQTRTVGFRPACNCGETASIPSTVLDPFNGAGTTGVVAIQHGRRYIGIELNPEYLEMARKRIQKTRDGITLPLGL